MTRSGLASQGSCLRPTQVPAAAATRNYKYVFENRCCFLFCAWTLVVISRSGVITAWTKGMLARPRGPRARRKRRKLRRYSRCG